MYPYKTCNNQVVHQSEMLFLLNFYKHHLKQYKIENLENKLFYFFNIRTYKNTIWL